jgi:hypothetical protein
MHNLFFSHDKVEKTQAHPRRKVSFMHFLNCNSSMTDM